MIGIDIDNHTLVSLSLKTVNCPPRKSWSASRQPWTFPTATAETKECIGIRLMFVLKIAGLEDSEANHLRHLSGSAELIEAT